MARGPSTTAGGLSAENARGRGDRTSASYNDRGAVVLRSSDRRLRGPPLTAERTTTTHAKHADAPRPTHSRVAKRARRASARATRKRNPPTGVRGTAFESYTLPPDVTHQQQAWMYRRRRPFPFYPPRRPLPYRGSSRRCVTRVLSPSTTTATADGRAFVFLVHEVSTSPPLPHTTPGFL